MSSSPPSEGTAAQSHPSEASNSDPSSTAHNAETELDDVEFCSYCSESFPATDPMVEFDGNTYCSPDCVREMLNNDDPCNHAQYVEAHARFEALLQRALENHG